jgi:hypothetical protein
MVTARTKNRCDNGKETSKENSYRTRSRCDRWFSLRPRTGHLYIYHRLVLLVTELEGHVMSRDRYEQLRKIYKHHYQECQRVRDLRKQLESSREPPMITHDSKIIHSPLRLPEFPAFPEECRGITCGAKTRTGTLCKLTSLYGNGRCKFHGGLSTGPKTVVGKARAALNGTLRSKAHEG